MKRFTEIYIILVVSTALAQEGSHMERDSYNFDVSEANRIEVDVDYGLGSLDIGPGADEGTIEGFIEYDPRYVTPEVKYSTFGSKGKLGITVRSSKHDFGHDEWSFNWDWKKMRDDEYRSAVDFKFPPFIPLDMNLDFGLGEANIDLSGLSISEFRLDCGLSDVRVQVAEGNTGTCRKVSIQSGLGDFDGRQLGNLKAREFHMEVGLGSADVDLTGDITDDLEGDMEVGLGSLDLLLPRNANIKLEIEHTFLSSVDVEGLVKDGDEWVSPSWNEELPTLELEISVGVGSVDVEVQ